MDSNVHTKALRLLRALNAREHLTKQLINTDREIGQFAGELLPALHGRGRLLKVSVGYDTHLVEIWDEDGQPSAILIDAPDAWELSNLTTEAEAETAPPLAAHAAQGIGSEMA